MKRIQIYLDDDLWVALHAESLLSGTSISELIRKAARARYPGNLNETVVDPEERRAAMMAIVGLWKDRTDLPDTETYVRNLR